MARRAPATSAEALREELVRLSQGLRAAQPQLFGKPDESFVSMGFQDVYVGALVKRLWLLFAAVACLLLAACVNSANLWVARAVARRHEMTIRVAIGASRSRVLRQLITESVLVSALAGTIGLLLGWWGLHALLAHAPTAIPRVEEISFFPAVLLSGAIGTIVAVAFGLLGATPSFRAGLASALGQRTLAGARGGARVRAGLLVTETALAVLLVCAAGLLVTSFYKLMTVDKGFSSAGVWSFAFARLPSDYDAARRQSFAETYLQRVRSLPGVTAAGALSNLPLQRGVNYPVTRDSRDDISEGGTELRMVTPGAIEALSIRLRYGRTIAEADLSTSAHVALVNESLARQFFGTANVVGQRLDVGRWKGQWLSPGYHAGTEIIGVVSDVRDIALDKRPRLTVYLPQPAAASIRPSRRRSSVHSPRSSARRSPCSDIKRRCSGARRAIGAARRRGDFRHHGVRRAGPRARDQRTHGSRSQLGEFDSIDPGRRDAPRVGRRGAWPRARGRRVTLAGGESVRRVGDTTVRARGGWRIDDRHGGGGVCRAGATGAQVAAGGGVAVVGYARVPTARRGGNSPPRSLDSLPLRHRSKRTPRSKDFERRPACGDRRRPELPSGVRGASAAPALRPMQVVDGIPGGDFSRAEVLGDVPRL